LLLVFLVLAWCAGAHKRTKKQEARKPDIDYSLRDDSGSKLRDKEQQRLSSK